MNHCQRRETLAWIPYHNPTDAPAGVPADPLHQVSGGLTSLEPGCKKVRIAPRPRAGLTSGSTSVEDLDGDSLARPLRLGFDTQGRLLETVVLVFDSGNELVIHAMKARSRMLDLLP